MVPQVLSVYVFFYLSISLNILILLQGHPSALWIASYKGSKNIVKQIIALHNDNITDDPSPDGTSAFVIALAKKYSGIIDIFLEKNIGYCHILNNAAKKERESSPKKQDKVAEKW